MGAGHQLQLLNERESRLVKLFALGDVNEDLIRSEMANLKRQRFTVEDELRALRPTDDGQLAALDWNVLEDTCAIVAQFLDEADEENRATALEALQISIVATQQSATLSGVLPLDVPELFTGQRASA